MENGNETKQEKKKGGVGAFFKAVFVHNIGLKLLAALLSAALVVLAVAL